MNKIVKQQSQATCYKPKLVDLSEHSICQTNNVIRVDVTVVNTIENSYKMKQYTHYITYIL